MLAHFRHLGAPAPWRLMVAIFGALSLFTTAVLAAAPLGDKYLIGAGKADITGPAAEITFAGYADTAQVGNGIRQRLYSRAFIVGEPSTPKNRFVYLVIDTAFGDTAIRRGIIEGVAALGSAYSVYGNANIAVTGTHTHAGPGAYMNYLLPQITSYGFSKQSYQAIVDGAVLSIKRAHESLQQVRQHSQTRVGPELTLYPGLPRYWHHQHCRRQHQPQPFGLSQQPPG